MSKIFLKVCIILFILGGVSCVYGQYPIFDKRPNRDRLCIESVLVKHYLATDFLRISEYFTGKENTGGDTILRVDDLWRAGLYLVVKLSQPACELSEDAELIFKYVLSDCKEEKNKVFELKSKRGRSHWVFVGMTGVDYHGCNQTFLAWSLEIYSNGECVSQESYLWDMYGGEPEITSVSGVGKLGERISFL